MADASIFRRARSEDAEDVVRLIKHGFAPNVLEMFIYGCSGITQFVQLQIEAMAFGGDSAYFVCELNERVIACAELRRRSAALFLNYVAVDSSCQRRGIARRLLAYALSALATPQTVRLELDVLDENHQAIAWYDSLGMRVEAGTGWYNLGRLEQRIGATDVEILGFPQAVVCYQQLGFSQFTAVSKRKSYAVGMLGHRWFRVTDPTAIDDVDLLGTLQRVDGARELLALIPVGGVVDRAPEAITRRRAGPLTAILDRLRG